MEKLGEQHTVHLPTLESFVSESDVPKLLQILKEIKEDTLKNHVSVLFLRGESCSGKSTLVKIMEHIAPSTGRASSGALFYPYRDVNQLNRSLCVYTGENSTCLHKFINERNGYKFPMLFSRPETIGDFGVAVTTQNDFQELDIKDDYNRKIMYLDLPHKFKPRFDQDGHFQDSIIQNCVDRFLNPEKYEYREKVEKLFPTIQNFKEVLKSALTQHDRKGMNVTNLLHHTYHDHDMEIYDDLIEQYKEHRRICDRQFLFGLFDHIPNDKLTNFILKNMKTEDKAFIDSILFHPDANREYIESERISTGKFCNE